METEERRKIILQRVIERLDVRIERLQRIRDRLQVRADRSTSMKGHSAPTPLPTPDEDLGSVSTLKRKDSDLNEKNKAS